MSDTIEFARLVGSERRVGDSLAGVSRHWRGDQERFLFISPHDDDAVLGAGLLMQLAQREHVPVYLLIITDGAMGYCVPEERLTVSGIRHKETFAAYQTLGLPADHIVWMGFPDCQLSNYLGRRPAASNDPTAIAGFTGLQNSLTHHLRQIRPSQCFIPTHSDLHPDHRLAHDELMISIFHAAGEIWPELGVPLPWIPHVNEFAVYCDFPAPPSLRIRTPQEFLKRKLDSIACFASQRQIAATVQAVADAGAEEYHRAYDLALYQPARYRLAFDQPPVPRTMR
ncbi:MAG: PIG-L family deacetylase [Phycisphaerae bacterium]|nr:PIG-L family deacetylase [Phycisphaerae bacterium]